MPADPTEIVSFDASAATTAALSAGKTYMFQATEDCCVTFAETPVATTSMTPIFAGIPYPITILDDGTDYKVAAIKLTTAGDLYISLMQGVNA